MFAEEKPVDKDRSPQKQIWQIDRLVVKKNEERKTYKVEDIVKDSASARMRHKFYPS